MQQKWWQEGIVYQIYPRSFNDSNGDGIGDLRGIINKLDYLQDLGIDIIWLCPVYESPNADNGYDISDYHAIMDEFGTMGDMLELIDAVHKRKMKIIMDLVVNHTSDEHPWFIKSRSSRNNEYRDYYIWRDGKEGDPPNNWGTFFGGSAWTYDEKTEQYYLHLFTEKQPDLNWENSRVRKEVYDIMHCWFKKGIDGFRMDVINMISKTKGMPDGKIKGNNSRYGDGTPYFVNGPRIHKYLQEMNREVLSKYDIMTVGETFMVSAELAKKYVDCERKELDMIFNFEIMTINHKDGSKWNKRDWKLTEIKEIIYEWYKNLKEEGWICNFLNNHDFPRSLSVFGDEGKYRIESAKMLATFIFTLPGTPYIYQGEEIGMTNIAYSNIEDYRDVETLNYYREMKEKGIPEEEIMEAIYRDSRDNARTPIQWDDSRNAGFTEGEPWIKVNPNYKEINIERARNNSDSIWNYYRNIIQIRKANPTLIYGDYIPLLPTSEKIFSYLRKDKNGTYLVILNFTGDKVKDIIKIAGINGYNWKLLANNYNLDNKNNNLVGNNVFEIKLAPYEARLYKLSAKNS